MGVSEEVVRPWPEQPDWFLQLLQLFATAAGFANLGIPLARYKIDNVSCLYTLRPC